jgi:DNA polymerase I
MSLINCDLKQIEIIVFAQLCKDPTLIDLLNKGKDIHKFIASNVYDKPEEEITDEERSSAKTSSFGIIYGNGAKTLSERTGRTQEWAQDFINTFYELFPKAKEWHEKIQKQVEKTGQLTLFTGMTLKFKKYPAKFDWQIRKGIKESYNPPDIKNHPVQHLAALIMAILAGQFYRNYAVHKRDKYLMINTVHDSLMLDCKDDYIDEAILDVSQTLESISLILKEKFNETMLVPIKIDISTGERWSEL